VGTLKVHRRKRKLEKDVLGDELTQIGGDYLPKLESNNVSLGQYVIFLSVNFIGHLPSLDLKLNQIGGSSETQNGCIMEVRPVSKCVNDALEVL